MRSRDGAHWSPREDIYSAASLSSVDAVSNLLSPAIEQCGSVWVCYDVIKTGSALVLPPQPGQDEGVVFRRHDKTPNGSFGEYSLDQMVQFANYPWGEEHDPWHLDVCRFGNMWLMLLNTGADGTAGANRLYLAYSRDGWNFTVVHHPLFASDTYRSSIVPKGIEGNHLVLWVYQAANADGTINLYELKLEVK